MSNYKNTHLFFYGKSKEFGEFSNFYPCTFVDENDIRFNCSEQYMMHGKAVLFDPDNKIVDSILAENDKSKDLEKKLNDSLGKYNLNNVKYGIRNL